MPSDLFFVIWFFTPAAIANVMPIFTAQMSYFKKFDAPIDYGRTLRGHRIFGSHKTWRGLVSGIIFSTVVLALQHWAVGHSDWLQAQTSQVDYATLPILLLGPLFALGALGGDAIESFFKRQRGIAPGGAWFPFDQTDYLIGAAIVTMPFVTLNGWQYVDLIVVGMLIHIGSTIIGYYIGVKERPI